MSESKQFCNINWCRHISLWSDQQDKLMEVESTPEDDQDDKEESEGEGTLEKESHQIDQNGENKKWSALLCRKDVIRKTAIIAFLWIAYFLCNIAFSVIDPFFPLEVR